MWIDITKRVKSNYRPRCYRDINEKSIFSYRELVSMVFVPWSSFSQSDDGIVFGSWMVISLSQQVRVPSPGFVERASVPQTSHLYRFPSLLGMIKSPYFLSSIGWLQQVIVPFPPRVIITSAPHLVHMYRFPTVLAIGTTSLYVRYSSISFRSGAMISFGSVTDWMSSGVRPG